MKNIVFSLLAFLPCLQVNGQTMVSVCNGDNQVLAWSSKDITAEIKTTSETKNGKTTNTTTTTVNCGGEPPVYTNTSSVSYNTKVVNKKCLWGEVPSKDAAVDLGTTITIEEDGKNVTYKVLWAPWNLGGSEGTTGLFFSYGEDGTKYAYDSEGKTIGFTTDCSSDGKDIANQWWGGDWQIPTKEMWQLLVNRKEDEIVVSTNNWGISTKIKAWANNVAGFGSIFRQNAYYTISYKTSDGKINSIILPCCGLYKTDGKVEDKNGSDAQAANYLSTSLDDNGDVYALHAWTSAFLKRFTLTISTENSTNDYYKKNYGYSIRPVRLVKQ